MSKHSGMEAKEKDRAYCSLAFLLLTFWLCWLQPSVPKARLAEDFWLRTAYLCRFPWELPLGEAGLL